MTTVEAQAPTDMPILMRYTHQIQSTLGSRSVVFYSKVQFMTAAL